MEIDRVTISMKKPLAKLMAARAQEQNRSVSNYAALVIEADLRAAGLLADTDPEPALQAFFAKVSAAAAASPRIVPRLEATLRRQLRQPKTAA